MTYYKITRRDKQIRIIELSPFRKFVKRYLNQEDYQNIRNYISTHSLSGDLVLGSGGLRKVRFSLSSNNKGKSGGMRIIHYYHANNNEVFLIDGFLKSMSSDITKNGYACFKKMIDEIINK